MNELSSSNCRIVSLRPRALQKIIFCHDKMLNDQSNRRILTTVINYY